MTRRRISLSEREARSEALRSQLARAHSKAQAGDESELRERTAGRPRVLVEAVVIQRDPCAKVGVEASGRRRKVTSPKFLTPSGVVMVPPSCDADFFLGRDQAEEAIALRLAVDPEEKWACSWTTVDEFLASKRYARWAKALRAAQHDPAQVKECKRALSETFEIYRAGGFDALRRLYTVSHCYKLLAKFRAAGYAVEPYKDPGRFIPNRRIDRSVTAT